MKHKFGCENNLNKCAFLLRTMGSRLEKLFVDVFDLVKNSPTAPEFIRNGPTGIPGIDLVIAGFPCQDLSTLTPWSRLFCNCINEAGGRTGGVFQAVLDLMRRFDIPMCIMENVDALSKVNRRTGHRNSDAVQIKLAIELNMVSVILRLQSFVLRQVSATHPIVHHRFDP